MMGMTWTVAHLLAFGIVAILFAMDACYGPLKLRRSKVRKIQPNEAARLDYLIDVLMRLDGLDDDELVKVRNLLASSLSAKELEQVDMRIGIIRAYRNKSA